SARSAFADESASEQNQGGTSAGGAVYSRVGGLKPFVASICGNVPSVKIYDRYGVGGVKSQCVAADGKKTADVVDEQISVWLAADPQARLGEPTLPKGGAAISYTVWSPILRAADRDHHALTVLRSSTDNPSLTAEQFQSALVRITTGYDGQSAPFAYQPYYDLPDAQGGIPYIPTKTPREMGISLTEAKRLLAGGTLFRHAGFGPPPPPPPPKDEVVEVVKEVRVKVPRFLPPEEIEKKVVKVVKVPQYLPPVEEVKEVVVEKRVKVPKYLPPVDEVEEVVVEKRVKVPKYLPPEQIEKEVVKEVKVKVPALLPPEEKEKEVAVPVDRGGRAAAEPSFVLVPQVAFEYDNGLFHGDLNVRYLHAVQNVRYQGLAEQAGKTYSVNNSAVGLFVGAGFGVNF
ncbi:MAG: hypothetical protein ORN57_01465, partial [Alphaproteobacteria bacterium]|nr:hypothetical protein [Alphaproteobacteria bacterium]